MGRSKNAPSFGEQFELYHSIQIVIDANVRSRASIDPDKIASSLLHSYPNMPVWEIRDAVVEAMRAANVPQTDERIDLMCETHP